MPETDYYIRKLEASDTVQNFKVGSEEFLPLKTFLQKQAKQFQQSSIAQTYVAVTDDKNIIGYVTLTCSEIDLQDGYELADCSHANNYEFLPAVKIARLAVDIKLPFTWILAHLPFNKNGNRLFKPLISNRLLSELPENTLFLWFGNAWTISCSCVCCIQHS